MWRHRHFSFRDRRIVFFFRVVIRTISCFCHFRCLHSTQGGSDCSEASSWSFIYNTCSWLILSKKSFSLVFWSITDRDNQGKVPNGSITDRDNRASFSLIITDNQAFSPLLSQPFQFCPWFNRINRNTWFQKRSHWNLLCCVWKVLPHRWTICMFQMVTGDSCQCMKRTKQRTACDVNVRHTS